MHTKIDSLQIVSEQDGAQIESRHAIGDPMPSIPVRWIAAKGHKVLILDIITWHFSCEDVQIT